MVNDDLHSFDALMTAVAKEQAGAFDELMECYAPEIMNYLNKLCRNLTLAEELAQDVFVKIYRKRKQYRPGVGGRSYLYSIARNLWVDYCRKRSVRKEVWLNPLNERVSDDTPADEACLNETQAAIKSAMGELSSIHRDVFILACYQGMAYQEIADTLDVPLGTVKSRVHNAMQKMQQLLREKYDVQW